jgi:hypothetical protein
MNYSALPLNKRDIEQSQPHFERSRVSTTGVDGMATDIDFVVGWEREGKQMHKAKSSRSKNKKPETTESAPLNVPGSDDWDSFLT